MATAKAKKAGRKSARKKTRKPSAPKRAEPEPEASDVPEAAEEIAAEDIVPANLSALKDGKLYYRIGEVSQITGVKPYVLRYWESEFRLMAPQKSRSKQRLYRQKDIETILTIKRLLYQERYTIAGARRKLRELGSAARDELVAETMETAAAEAAAVSRLRGEFRRVRDELLGIRALLAAEA
jgi:DNA-binding transcriptional MerR regulator